MGNINHRVYAGLAELDLRAGDFFKSGKGSVRGPCPRCGGSRRFVLFVDKEYPSWWGMCDECGVDGWLDQLFPHKVFAKRTPLSPEKLALAVKKEAKELAASTIKKHKLLSDLGKGKPWEMYHENMSNDGIKWWEDQGIPKDWQQVWQLGETERTFTFDEQSFSTIAYTIPKFDPQGNIRNIDYRLLNYPKKGGKYRPFPDLDQYPFIATTNPKELLSQKILIVEGSKKAMVTFIYQEVFQNVIGIPSCNSWADVTEVISGNNNPYVLLDPGADAWAHKLAAEIGHNCKIMSLPAKIDDCFTKYGLTGEDFETLVNWARPPY